MLIGKSTTSAECAKISGLAQALQRIPAAELVCAFCPARFREVSGTKISPNSKLECIQPTFQNLPSERRAIGCVGIKRRAQASGVGAINGLSGPVNDHLRRDFGMELDAINRLVEAEGLLAALVGISQGNRAGRQHEGFTVPVEKRIRRGQATEDGIR